MRWEAGGSHVFSGVVVDLPTKVSTEADEEWQKLDWVTWSTGDVCVDPDTFALVFNPSELGGAIKGKPLGNLARVRQVADETLVITTSDQLHRLYRMTFGSSKDAREFVLIAETADAASAAANRDRDDSPERGDSNVAAKQLEADICARFGDQHPLIYGGVELYGLDPNGEEGAAEVLRGRGAIVLLDPPNREAHRVGSYEFHFYSEDDGAGCPTVSLVIGPKMALTRHASDDSDPYAIVFTLPGSPGGSAHTLAFENASVAAAFNRDYRVRQLLMNVAVKTVKGSRAALELRGEIEQLKKQHILLRLWRMIVACAMLFLFCSAVRLVMLYVDSPGGQPAAYMRDLLREISVGLRLSQSILSDTVAKACQTGFGALRAPEVHRCLSLDSIPKIKNCVDVLGGSTSEA